VSFEAKSHNAVLFCLVEGSELLGQIRPGDVWPRGVEDINDELTAGKEAVGDELASTNSDWCVGHTS